MSTPDYLWPARPEYLRRGTPTYWLEPDTGDLYRGEMSDSDDPDQYLLDLRDVTARAHAAMAYTVVTGIGAVEITDPLARALRVSRLEAGVTFASPSRAAEWWLARAHAERLTRMRCMDESVTVAEARAALAWAESVVRDE